MMIKYCESVFQTKRWKTREVLVGSVGVGGGNPIRIQSMTTSDTRNATATVEQIMRLADAGCEIARITVQGMKEAEACEQIKNQLIQHGYEIPIVADIHFFPPAAMTAINFVDKVRINPGNYADKRASFATIDYTEASYANGLEKIEEKFTPLIEKCKKLKRSMRIGTNHGSLSDRIMNRHGDTPRGMVESALEFARLCRKNDFHDFLFSMKSSNPQVMIQAYRLLVAEMMSLDWNYPLHLGVTEAGEGEDGQVKSAMGIGSLLLDGIGDTIRISLTEDPWNEIAPCKRLIALANSYEGTGVPPFIETHRHAEEIKRRPVIFPKEVSLHRDGSVIANIKESHSQPDTFYKEAGYDVEFNHPKLKVTSIDCLIVKETSLTQEMHQILKNLNEIGISILSKNTLQGHIQFLTLREALVARTKETTKSRFNLYSDQKNPLAVIIGDEPIHHWADLEIINPSLIILAPTTHRLHYCRQFFDWLQTKNLQIPVILGFKYTCSKEDLIIHAAAEYGALFCDGLGDGIWIDAPHELDFLRHLSFNILQAARMRASKTDFISCPSCGRTLFDLQDVSRRIRSRTSHLPGVKIAIMGCIVNGPGEMADAHFGYVGSQPGMVDLYVGKQRVEKNIPFEKADDRLVELIKKHDRWIEPKEVFEISLTPK